MTSLLGSDSVKSSEVFRRQSMDSRWCATFLSKRHTFSGLYVRKRLNILRIKGSRDAFQNRYWRDVLSRV